MITVEEDGDNGSLEAEESSTLQLRTRASEIIKIDQSQEDSPTVVKSEAGCQIEHQNSSCKGELCSFLELGDKSICSSGSIDLDLSPQ